MRPLVCAPGTVTERLTACAWLRPGCCMHGVCGCTLHLTRAACLTHLLSIQVPIEKIFNKSLLAKFLWAMDTEPEFHF